MWLDGIINKEKNYVYEALQIIKMIMKFFFVFNIVFWRLSWEFAQSDNFSTIVWWNKRFNKSFIWDIASFRINLSLKTVQLSPPIFGQVCEKLIFCFFPYIPRITSSYKIFYKNNFVCGLHFCYFNLTLGHFDTFNTWNSHKKPFQKIVDMVNIFHLQP